MINKIIGITGCILGITGCVANIVTNNKIKRVSIDMENHVNCTHSKQNSITEKIENSTADLMKFLKMPIRQI